MVRNPVVGSISQMLLSFNSASQAYVENIPQMEGKTFGDVYKWYTPAPQVQTHTPPPVTPPPCSRAAENPAVVPLLLCRAWPDPGCRFPDGIVFGLVNQYSAEVKVNPPASTFVTAGDSLLVIRPNGLPGNRYSPATAPVAVDIGTWTASDYSRASYDEAPMGKNSGYTRAAAMTGRQHDSESSGNCLATPWGPHMPVAPVG